MRTALVITVLGSALALPGSFVASAHAQAPAAAHPNIDGAWVLNRDMGDPMQRGGGGGGESSDGGGGGGHRRGGGGGGYGVSAMGHGGGMGGGGPMSDEQKQEMERRRALMKELLQPSDRMNVTVENDMVTFTESDGRVRKFKTDGKKEKHQFDNGTVETKSKWDNSGLVIETDLNGTKLTQTYTIAAGERRQLVLATKMEGGGGGGMGHAPSGDSGERKPIMHYYDDAKDVQ